MKKFLTIVGTRPEAIKMAPVIKELEKYPHLVSTTVCLTGQHREIVDQVMSIFELRASIDLALMEEDQPLSRLTARAIAGLTEVLEKETYDVVLVQGDTTTAMVAALVAFYKTVPLAHVEAGLRTNDRYNPFPEEINRRLITTMASWNFAPTQAAVDALRHDGIPADAIYLTGNTVVDALRLILAKKSNAPLRIPVDGKHRLLLVTAHRRESFGEPLENICEALRLLAERHGDIEIVYPVHPNPNVHNTAHRILKRCDRIHLVAPVDYETFVQWMNRAYLILTDSGGIQEEASALGKPVLVLRKVTERPDGVACGLARLVGQKSDEIVKETERLLDHPEEYERMAQIRSLYGDGHASERIVNILLSSMLT